MILDSEASNSDTKMKDSDFNIRNSKIKTLYLSIICFATNFLSSITLETGLYGSHRYISPARSAVFNNLFHRNYNLRIKIMAADILTALISTMMLTIGDIYKIPYLYLPWLVNTIEGIVFYEGPALFKLASVILPNGSVPAGLFTFLTLIFYVQELYIWREIFVNFERCWINYNTNNKLNADSMKDNDTMNKKLCNENKENLNIPLKRLQDQDSTAILNICNRDQGSTYQT